MIAPDTVVLLLLLLMEEIGSMAAADRKGCSVEMLEVLIVLRILPLLIDLVSGAIYELVRNSCCFRCLNCGLTLVP